MQKEVRVYSLPFTAVKTYLTALLFVMGNVVLPQLCHLVPQGGMIFLPIYFFTLIGAYKFGWRVGVLAALFSPLVNSALFGMPAVALLPVILVKSTLLALAAAWVASRLRAWNLFLQLVLVVLAYQLLGGLFEWAWTGSLASALQDWRLGMPGMCLQIVGGFLFVKYTLTK